MKNTKPLFIDKSEILNWAISIISGIGVSEISASTIASSLIKTSLWGIDSHGIERIPHYLNRYETGSINKHPYISFTKTAEGTGQIDGDDGHGILILNEATKYAIKLAKKAGIGAIGVQNSSHCGAIGLYTREMAKQGMVGIAFTHSDSLVVPFGGKKAFFGTNPISIAFPTANDEEPICLDMATSITPWNYIMNAKRENKNVPKGYGLDINGNDTEIASDIVAVQPMANYKGYAMAFLIDMLCGPLNGMAFGPHITPMYQNLNDKRKLGSLVITIDPDKFGGREYLRAMGSQMIEQIKSQGNNILFPGQPEYIKKKERLKTGIPVSESLKLEFEKWSQKLDVKSPKYINSN